MKFDTSLRDKVLERSKAIGLTDYTAIIFPRLTPIYGRDVEMTDIEISYPMDLRKQTLDFKHFFDEDFDDVAEKLAG